MNIARSFVILPHAISRSVGDETVILEFESGRYFGPRLPVVSSTAL